MLGTNDVNNRWVPPDRSGASHRHPSCPYEARANALAKLRTHAQPDDNATFAEFLKSTVIQPMRGV